MLTLGQKILRRQLCIFPLHIDLLRHSENKLGQRYERHTGVSGACLSKPWQQVFPAAWQFLFLGLERSVKTWIFACHHHLIIRARYDTTFCSPFDEKVVKVLVSNMKFKSSLL